MSKTESSCSVGLLCVVIESKRESCSGRRGVSTGSDSDRVRECDNGSLCKLRPGRCAIYERAPQWW